MTTPPLFRLLNRLVLLISMLGPCLVQTLQAEIKPASFFGNHMVLQQGMPVPVWGKAGRGEEITVEFAGQRKTSKAGEDGKWRIDLQPLAANKTPQTLTITSKDSKVTYEDVLVGEVWLCSGQSNMEWTVDEKGVRVAGHEAVKSAANQPLIRQLRVPKSNAKEPAGAFKAVWQICSPETVGGFSGVAYFYASELSQKLNVPVGLINASYGGTPVEAWMNADTMKSNPACAPAVARFAKVVADWPQISEKYRQENQAWTEKSQAAKAAGTPFTEPAPRQPVGPGHPYSPTTVYNAMLHPLIPAAMRGVIWYQGEANTSRAGEYHGLFSALIQQWRQEWKQGDFPFLFVQLANFKGSESQPTNWAWLRDAQAKTLAVPNTGMAVTIDIGETNNIHPANKQDVGKRLSLIALNKVYGQKDLEYSGPVFERCDLAGGKIKVRFKHATGLKAKGEVVTGFEIAGEDKKFVPTNASIQDDTVLVEVPGSMKPMAVRYAWTNAPKANLYNAAGLPAAPFRSDSWPADLTDNN